MMPLKEERMSALRQEHCLFILLNILILIQIFNDFSV